MISIDRYGRAWNLPETELCSTCWQPDNCGDCNHTALSGDEAAELGALDIRFHPEPLEHIDGLLAYNWPQEQRDYEDEYEGAEGAVFAADGTRVWHVFERMRIIDDWLKEVRHG